jgi:hypothetical protein
MADLVTVKTFTTRVQAELVKGILEAENVPAIIFSDDEGGMMAYPFSLVKGVRLQVRKADSQKAKKILKELSE